MPVKGKLAFYTAIVFAILLVLAGNGFAAAPSNASLTGSYEFHLASAKLAYWSTSKVCTVNGNKQTEWASNMDTYTELVYGVATFDGKGHVSLSFTQDGQLDQASSNATITITCTKNGATNTGGHMVYLPAQAATATGTYEVSNTGTGSMTITISDSSDTATMDFQLSAFGSNGVASTALIHYWDGDNNKRIGTGIAVHK